MKMTFEEFQKRVRGNNGFHDRVTYAIAAIFILFGLFLFFAWLTSSKNGPPVFFFALYFTLLGLYLIWRIPKQYKIRTINWEASPSVKSAIILQYLKSKEIKIEKQHECFIEARHVKRLLNGICLIIYINEDAVFINAQPGYEKGPIDFGLSNLAANRLERHLLSKLLR